MPAGDRVASARASDGRSVWGFDAIGTVWRIDTAAPLPADVRAAVAAEIDAFDRAWSRFRPDSTVTALAAGGEVAAPVDAALMLDRYAELSHATGGAVNPLVGGALARRGYDAAYSLVDRGAEPAPADWRAVLTWQGATLRLAAPAVVDVGALGKGRLVDRVLAVIGAAVPGDVVVDAGGDLAVRLDAAAPPERVALQHPFDHSRAIGVWEVSSGALCASAVDRRAWGDGLHHVLDARTGQPVRTIAATWVRADDAFTADGLATALFFDGGAEAAHRRGASWVRLSTDGRLEWSPGCDADLFIRT
ncbi:FAD:protein FMN transferase [Microbacterium telephonicum]|uniref:FAD:protein FMN transferase n=1 Tax=Microbacterium telephonicum TaxID=1714841 RepID=A0A498C7D1_9MICO|nr:FAD:protein FMN transferase [Microbacterium telephonicum]RLK48970.1 thiamine biosynthesis lipoprotein [Microbacterium telephonicum]